MKTSCLIVLCFANLATGIIVTVTIPNLGKVGGGTTSAAWSGRTIYQFLSIKYAMSPSGVRRFMPPEPAPAWKGVYNATRFRRGCPEMGSIHYEPPYDDLEDCLTLCVYTPMNPNKAAKLLPVMVYIHGGAFANGNASVHPPNYLLEHDVLLVVPQYRLGPLGFLSLQTDGIPGNVGLMDQVLALRWVNQNIRWFGGDNTKVTIFGQSAGACSVSLHLLSPIVEPYLFQKAIIMSGSSYAGWAIDNNPLQIARDIYRQLTNDTNMPRVSKMESAFKSATVEELFKATIKYLGVTKKANTLLFKPVAQKAGTIKYLTKDPVDYLVSGEFRTLPMMAGVTKNDGTFLTAMIYNWLEKFGFQNDEHFLRTNLTAYSLKISDVVDDSGALLEILENKYFKQVYDLKKNLTFADIEPGESDLLGVLWFKGQVLKQAKTNVNYEPNSTYLYTFDYRGEHTNFGFGWNASKYPFDGGVSHSDDMIYLFPEKQPLNEKDTKMAKIMTELWTSFAINGKPSSSGMPIQWPKMEINKNGPYLHINSVWSYSDDFVENEFQFVSKS